FVTTLGILDASSQAAIPDDGAWHHIAVVHENGVELRYYVDGVLGHTRPYTSGVIFTRTQTFFTIGAEHSGGLQYIGSLDRLKVTSGILRPDELDFKAVPAGAGKPPIANGLVAYWNFEGNFKDQAGKFDGTPAGAEPIAFVTGKSGFGKAIKLNGEDQEVEITGGEPDDLAFAGGSISIAGWFKVDAFDTSWQALIAKGEGSNWRVHRRGGESGFAHAGGTGEGPAGAAVDDGQWHHFAAISDAAAANFGTALYIDGVQYSVNANTPNLAANGKRVMIGENPDAVNREWEGEIDDLAIWDRVLTEAEIGQLYAKGAGKPLSELLGAVVGDADKDGIPDTAEIAFGFNPNDPTDAPKDFDKDGVSNLDEFKAGTDPIDVTKPTIATLSGSPTFDKVTITFSEELDPATATVAANYSISPALAVTAVTYNRKVATLTTAKQAPGATAYTVTVKGVKDTSKNEIAADTTALFYSYLTTRTGVLRFAYWTGITGTPVDNLLNDANYPATPTGVGAVFSFNSRDFFPGDSLENYGAVIEGFVTPTESASYDFFLRSDDASQLFISTDDKEANLAMIAEETGCCGAFMEPATGDGATTQAPIALVAGRKYFIRVIYKEGGGGDFAQVAWRKTTDKTPAGSLLPIPGQFLSAAVDLPAPAEGAFTTQSPGPNARNFKPANPVTIAHRDGKTEWSAANVTLKFDGVDVKPTFTKTGNLATIEYKPSTLLASKSTHTVSLGYLDPGGKPATLSWSFETAEYKGPVKDLVKGYEGLILGSAKLSGDKGGFSGKAGDYAVDFGRGSGQSVLISDASFLNAAAAGDKMTFSLWVKKYDIANNSAFWADSPSSSGGQRGAQAHTPWSNNNVYFDTAGCCDGATQRINAGIDTFADYTGDISWWTNAWHHFAFVKDASRKQIWIDGKVFLEGENTNPLPTDFARIWIGAEGGGPNAGTANNIHGLQDDFAIFGSALAEADIKKLAAGGSPSTLGAATKLVAYWDFNGALAAEAAKFTKIARNADGTITLEWTGGGTLEAATSVTGPWQAVTGATSPYKFT
ncbi:MAG: Ig-like domain-containing protein, partial [Verrucomicrobia bacterium]|nr:Ig-like domain-containing protein [Verrucomicrobiota bacterium]